MKTSRKLWESQAEGILKEWSTLSNWSRTAVSLDLKISGVLPGYLFTKDLLSQLLKVLPTPQGPSYLQSPSPKVIPLSGLNPSKDRWMQVYTSHRASRPELGPSEATLVPELPAAAVEPAPKLVHLLPSSASFFSSLPQKECS